MARFQGLSRPLLRAVCLLLTSVRILAQTCADTIKDQATGTCISASSTPLLGKLYPLTTQLNVDYLGRVGIGTATPSWPVHVVATQAVGRFDSANSTYGSVIELRNKTVSPTLLGGINFVNSAGQFPGQISYKASNELTFRVNSADRLFINGFGHVSVGAPANTFNAGPAFEVTSIGGGVGGAIYGSSSNPALTASGSFVGLGGTVLGSNQSPNGIAVYGWGNATTGGNIGVYGRTSSPSGTAVFSYGNFTATGTKSFVQPHPSNPSKEIRFVCLEGNESGTYFRGTAALAGGRAEIEVPEEFRLVSEQDGITVQVTPLGRALPLAVESKGLERIVVIGAEDVEFDYFVNGVRRGFADLECIGENQAFVPEERDVPYGTQYPEALRRILVENGILNADFTPNEATAARLGWTLADPSEARLQQGEPR